MRPFIPTYNALKSALTTPHTHKSSRITSQLLYHSILAVSMRHLTTTPFSTKFILVNHFHTLSMKEHHLFTTKATASATQTQWPAITLTTALHTTQKVLFSTFANYKWVSEAKKRKNSGCALLSPQTSQIQSKLMTISNAR